MEKRSLTARTYLSLKKNKSKKSAVLVTDKAFNDNQGREFEALVRDAVKSLPREFKRKLENINIVILEEPSARQKKETGAGEDLAGALRRRAARGEDTPRRERSPGQDHGLPGASHAVLPQPAGDTKSGPGYRSS